MVVLEDSGADGVKLTAGAGLDDTDAPPPANWQTQWVRQASLVDLVN
jgi:hypothetical protein